MNKISAGYSYSLALLQNGAVCAWGSDDYHNQCDFPVGLTNVTAIATGDFHSLALLQDGTIRAWGFNRNDQCTVPKVLRCPVPYHFVCPISLSLMEDPVVTPSGVSYERECIEKWVKHNRSDPLTREPLLLKDLYPNKYLCDAIVDFLAQ